jgi:hypothetical protein
MPKNAYIGFRVNFLDKLSVGKVSEIIYRFLAGIAEPPFFGNSHLMPVFMAGFRNGYVDFA